MFYHYADAHLSISKCTILPKKFNLVRPDSMVKGRQMGHCVMISPWCEPLLTNTIFRFVYFRMNNCKAHLMLHQEKELPNDSGRPSSYNNFTNKKQNGCC